MEEKIYIQDIINIVAEKHSLTKKDAETFVKALFELIEESLEKDEIVKIKGLGTFKLIKVENRESVDVNTGERFQIKGHTKVSFIPDSSVRELINKPFSHFETVILNENTNFDDLATEQEEQHIQKSNDEIENGNKLDSNEIVEEIKTEEAEVSPADIIIDETEEITPEPTQIPEPASNTPELIEEIIEPVDESCESIGESPTSIEDQPLPEDSFDETITPSIEIDLTELSGTGEVVKKRMSRNARIFSFITIIVVTVFMAGSIMYYIYKPPFLTGLFEDKMEKIISDSEQRANAIVAKNIQGEKTKSENETPSTEEINNIAKKDTVVPVLNTVEPIATNNETALVNDKKNTTPAEEKIIEPQPVKEEVKVKEEPIVKIEPQVKEEIKKPIVQQPSPSVKEVIQSKSEEKKTEPETVETKESGYAQTIITGVRKGQSDVKPDSTKYKIIGTMADHIVGSGETLTKISMKFYETKDLWPYIVMHNRKAIRNPNNVPAGTKLKIPALRDK